MIYVSTACVKAESIKDAVLMLVEQGFKAIELSGGTEYYPELEDDLLELKEKHGLSYLCHNYFPPPKEHFILNLGSVNDYVFERSVELCKSSIALSKKLGGKKYAVHAGFFMDIQVDEFGTKIGKRALVDQEASYQRFKEGFSELQRTTDGVELYVENNVLSIANAQTYSETNPFMFTNLAGLKRLHNELNFSPLVDVAHLKVSLNSHREVYGEDFDFDNELKALIDQTDYVHVSDNDGHFDQGKAVNEEGNLYLRLAKQDLSGKDITLEVYDGMKELKQTYNAINALI